MTYPGLGFGNYLYFVLRAFIAQEAGRSFQVVDHGLDEKWVVLFPGLAAFLTEPASLSRLDRRTNIAPLFHQAFGVDYSADELAAFVERVLVASPVFQARTYDAALDDDRTVTINVRRGDYYAVPEFKSAFGIDTTDYVRRALTTVRALKTVETAYLVSDDLNWCREALSWLGDDLGLRVLTGPPDDPTADFVSLARSRRLIITNSTFSYWGAYVSRAVHGSDHHGVWAPDLHSRTILAGRPWQHDPAWHSIDPGPAPPLDEHAPR